MGNETVPELPQDSLFSFLGEKLGTEQVKEVWEVLKPYYEIARSENYPLRPQEELDESKIVAAIQGFFENSVIELAFYSVSRPYPKPKWMTDEVYQASLRASLTVSFGDSFGPNLQDGLGASLEPNLWDKLGDSLTASLTVSLGDSFRDSFWNGLRLCFWVILGASLFFYLASVLAGKQDEADRFKKLLEAQRGCAIIGRKCDDPDTWIILCG